MSHLTIATTTHLLDPEALVRPLAQVVGEAMVDLGVTQFFGVLGSGNLEATSYSAQAGASFLHARHENAAMMMAAAHTEVSGRSAVCTVHQGPGLTNALTGLVECAKSGIPAIVLAGATPQLAMRGNSYIDQERLAHAAGALARTLLVDGAEPIGAQLRDAIRAARAKSLPLLVNVPVDHLRTPVAEPRARYDAAGWRPVPHLAARGAMDEAVATIRTAKRPVIIVGRGAVIAGATDLCRQLARRLRAPAGTTALVHGALAGYSRNLGIIGGFSTQEAAEVLRAADVVIAIGARLTAWTTGDGDLISAGARMLHISTTEPDASLDREYVACRGDARLVVAEIIERLGERDAEQEDGWDGNRALAALQGSSGTHAAHEGAGRDSGLLNPREMATELDALLPTRTVVVDGGDNAWYGTLFTKPAGDGRSFVFTPAGFQSIGLGLAAGIGAAVARPDQLTVISLGDCGALMAAGELDTLARSPVPVIVIVYNDSAGGAEVHHFANSSADVSLAQFPTVELGAVAASFGLDSLVVRSLADLQAIDDWLHGPRTRSLLIDARIDPDFVMECAAEAFL
ncbi:thiamine pyrophosphate-binding protein [Nonomuraea sp. NPDC049400]|uniref:thiamine pyrophosphate-binding protein n=1 Tax=Nonomuraea sp. NPDC049400 TaxID=3364352 RepID=UPI00379B9325